MKAYEDMATPTDTLLTRSQKSALRWSMCHGARAVKGSPGTALKGRPVRGC